MARSPSARLTKSWLLSWAMTGLPCGTRQDSDPGCAAELAEHIDQR